MRITTLISHCGQLLNIIVKNHKPSDRIASEYFRSKKYIGSKERKFIAETIFSTIRNLLLIENLAEKLSFSISSPEKFQIYTIIQIILAEKFPNDFPYFRPTSLYNKVNNNSTDILNSILNEFFTDENAAIHPLEKSLIDENTIEFILNYFSDLNKKIDFLKSEINSSKNNTNFNSNNINELVELISIRFSFPKNFINFLLKNSNYVNLENLTDFALAFNIPAPICIRINNLHSNIDKMIEYFAENEIEAEKGKISNSCLVIKKRHQIIELPAYKNGMFEIQDEASQLVGFCANPDEKAAILDACAGAGGKSLHLADLQNDKGEIIASDVEFMRIKEIPKRAARCGIESITTGICNKNGEIELIQNNFNSFSRSQNKKIKQKNKLKDFDLVIVDAPCTGAGTIRREPMKKYRITPQIIEKIAEKQFQILSFYSKFVKKNGFLIYSTCSIFPQENEFIVERFLNENPDFSPEPIFPHFQKHKISIPNLSETAFHFTFFPFLNATDGFFISNMKKIH
jgi:16S rRNA (cytosine967-C5)-methyltransferase